ncbi:uncharacterized protein AB675_11842 [Cyphellophora attinorum]|uniref:Uncharacterized protein n=1 Tax=Cyphellophora attinorum TaxID=1664694 RepID=A0A0N1H5A3_9EURO|nr:uncharacterized protein AB675_11842 [Phialophora attinorum]KPI36863.1 hypothetical protein AB675_11842 [Phialophora attinorum]
MTLKKKVVGERSRSYDTFEESSSSAVQNNPSSSQKPDKSKLAGEEAQNLATSQSFWRDEDETLPRQPTSSRPGRMGHPAELEARGPYQDDPNDPPPIYTPSDSVATPLTPSSPVAARAQPHPQSQPQVGDPSSPTSPTHPTTPYEDSPRPSTEENESYARSTLLELAQQRSNRHPRRRGCGGPLNALSEHRKDRERRRFRKICWFTLALSLCLWFMIPGMLSGKAHTHTPGWWHQHNDSSRNPIPSSSPNNPLPGLNREYHQHETSQSITGSFPLYDVLDLSTTSGSIIIDVEPHPGPNPAVMKLSTRSGSIRVRMGSGIVPWLPSSDATNRTFQSTLETTSGSVSGSLLAGNGGTTAIETQSGSLSLTIHALDSGGPKGSTSKLSTTTQSGSQNIKVSSSSTEDLKNWEAEHVVRGSGSMGLSYPRRWVGRLEMRSMGSGSLSARGSGLVLERGGSKEVSGWRGDREGRVVAVEAQGSGSVRFLC